MVCNGKTEHACTIQVSWFPISSHTHQRHIYYSSMQSIQGHGLFKDADYSRVWSIQGDWYFLISTMKVCSLLDGYETKTQPNIWGGNTISRALWTSLKIWCEGKESMTDMHTPNTTHARTHACTQTSLSYLFSRRIFSNSAMSSFW